ncbi:MAG: transposase [Bacillota bacterium]
MTFSCSRKKNKLIIVSFLSQSHIIWCQKFGYNVLRNEIHCELKDLLYSIATRYEYEIKDMEIMPDRIHLFKSTKPTVSPTDVASDS